ncbi:uncharacterized protein C6orf136 homolog [Chiroxiphia lanceolata]|uniref:uncharacterized protein C6orf136 homolog n=1 Tax=Chiroxiphia lanceolata TaxID=296741 RepID=UPI0013CF238A|nr:uncharacterized protein C6orf136 homolog [Chiroxiphia lanceolata]
MGGAGATVTFPRGRMRGALPPPSPPPPLRARAGAVGATGVWGKRSPGAAAPKLPPCTGTSPPPPPPSACAPRAPTALGDPPGPARNRPGDGTGRGRRTCQPPGPPCPRCCPSRPAPPPPRGLEGLGGPVTTVEGLRGPVTTVEGLGGPVTTVEGLGGPVTTVDGRREDDIAVRDPPRLLLRPPGGALLAQGPPKAPGATPTPPSMEEHLALMHEKLRHELPNFFLKIPDYGLYSQDVEFINHLLHLHTRGRPMYQVAVALCRALAWGYFASLRLEVLALTRHPEDWSVRARWRLTGVPLHLLLLRFYRRDKRQLLRSYDAFSTFFLNSQGLIRCHRVDKLMPAPTAVPEAKKLLVAAAVAVVAVADPAPALRLLLRPEATSGDT